LKIRVAVPNSSGEKKEVEEVSAVGRKTQTSESKEFGVVLPYKKGGGKLGIRKPAQQERTRGHITHKKKKKKKNICHHFED